MGGATCFVLPPSCRFLSAEAPVWQWDAAASVPVVSEELCVAIKSVGLILGVESGHRRQPAN